MGEIWDIYDVNKQLTGRTMKRNDWNMKDGDYHLTVLGIIKRHDNTFLITQRVLTKAWAPGHWEVSGGACQAGETSFQAVCREVLEETGVDVSHADGGFEFLTEEIILKKRIIILLISISLTWILQKQIYIYRQKRLPVSDLLQQKKSRLSLTEENFFITTA